MILLKPKKHTIFVFLFLCFAFQVQAQQPETAVSEQYQEMPAQGSREISKSEITKLWRNTMDSLRRERQLLQESQAKLAANDQLIKELKSKLTSKEQDVAAAKANVDQVSVLGISMNKDSYNTFILGLLLLMAAGLTFTILKTKASVKEARYRISLYNELFEEFRDYKGKANEKEKKLARELQTERNRIAELTGHSR